MAPEEPWTAWSQFLAAVPLAYGCCCTCNGSGLDGDGDTCRDCHGTGIDNHGA
ncbi:hypothetical protein [Nonomuraea basaltis]|uniref:hypothetical protein n=1 Tax=Nonomuraea basaltis TaxID=2495887 RepID=UPI001485F173|nr:hypothetical protein [Nonomuraea basaltis]